MHEITEILLGMKDPGNAAFQARLTPPLPEASFLGVRVPALRTLEKKYRGTRAAESFMGELPHTYFDENMLHAVFLSGLKTREETETALDAFLPYTDNWAVCDTLRPAVYRKDKKGLVDRIRGWTASPEPFVCRFGTGMLMTHFLDGDFRPEYPEIPAAVRSDDYYVNMMTAWYFATALAKQWDAAVPYLEDGRLSVWVHNRTIRKACESFRIPEARKKYLKSLRRTE